MIRFTLRRSAVLALPLVGLLSCSAGKAPPAATDGTAAQDVTVQVVPPSAVVATGGSVQFGSLVTGSGVTTVSWTVREGATGGAVNPDTGYYTAPGTPGTYHVEAASTASPTVKAAAVVTVQSATPVVVTLSPSPGAVDACKTLTFSATVTGTTNQAVDWSVVGSPANGTVAAGVYTAPSTAGTYQVVATSRAAPTSSATANVVVSDRIVSVVVSPPTVTVLPNGTAQFTATVTTSCGSFSALQAVAVAQ